MAYKSAFVRLVALMLEVVGDSDHALKKLARRGQFGEAAAIAVK